METKTQPKRPMMRWLVKAGGGTAELLTDDEQPTGIVLPFEDALSMMVCHGPCCRNGQLGKRHMDPSAHPQDKPKRRRRAR